MWRARNTPTLRNKKAPFIGETLEFGVTYTRTQPLTMDFDQLNSFLEVAKHSSFSKAAERCFRTQPAISSQIRALEEEVGAKLFDRSGAKVQLTVAGKAFQAYAEEALRSLKSVKTTIAEMERTPRGEIVVGANEATCLYILPEVFADFKRQYPKVSVSIQRAETAKTAESVVDQTVDFGVVSMPVKDARLAALPIHHDEQSPRSEDRKSTRLNSSHLVISYAVFCLKQQSQP